MQLWPVRTALFRPIRICLWTNQTARIWHPHLHGRDQAGSRGRDFCLSKPTPLWLQEGTFHRSLKSTFREDPERSWAGCVEWSKLGDHHKVDFAATVHHNGAVSQQHFSHSHAIALPALNKVPYFTLPQIEDSCWCLIGMNDNWLTIHTKGNSQAWVQSWKWPVTETCFSCLWVEIS